MIDVYRCDQCDSDDSMKNSNGKMTCIKCGLISHHIVFVPDLHYLLKRNKKVKSVHRRNKWFMRKIRPIVSGLSIDALTSDFIKVVNVLIEKKLINKNVSRYNYYIIRLCSKNNVKIKVDNGKKIQDMKEGKTKRRFDNNLFNTVYKKLGWEKVAMKNCPYYRKWYCDKVKNG